MRGLKFLPQARIDELDNVALLVSAWIEMSDNLTGCLTPATVALLVSAWIEI